MPPSFCRSACAGAAASAATTSSAGMTMARARRGLLAEADLDTVPILHLVVAPLETQPGLLSCLRQAAGFEQLFPVNDLGADEPAGQIAVNLSRRIDGRLAPADRPGADFVGSDGEERDQS